jgi:hypothetical protein
MNLMLTEHLDKFADDETGIEFALSLGMSTENVVVQPVSATATRCDDAGEGPDVVKIRAYLSDIMAVGREAAIGYVDDESGGLAFLGDAAFDLAEETLSSHIFAIEMVQAYGADKGTGLALLLLGATLETFSSGRVITAVLEACPLNPEQLTADELKAGRKKLRAHWAKLGFRRASPRSNHMVLIADNYEIPKAVLGAL